MLCDRICQDQWRLEKSYHSHIGGFPWETVSAIGMGLDLIDQQTQLRICSGGAHPRSYTTNGLESVHASYAAAHGGRPTTSVLLAGAFRGDELHEIRRLSDDARGFPMAPDRKFMYERVRISATERAAWGEREEQEGPFVSPAVAEFNEPVEVEPEKWYKMNRARVAASTNQTESVRQYFNPFARLPKVEE